MTRKLRRQKEHLRFVLMLLKDFDFIVERNTGIFFNKITFHAYSGQRVMTKEQLKSHIQRTKMNIRKTLDRGGR